MTCPDCGAEAAAVTFAVPPDLREAAPDRAAVAAVCPRCLAVAPAAAFGADESDGEDPAFSRVHERFPAGAGGVAFALFVGTLPSVTLRKESASRLRAAAEREGVDVDLALDRLAGAPGVEPQFDLERRAAQADALLE
ncbi:DUF6276 family protein [Candidatus Halobonum tyrrellensis]|uniref:Small CPxCG-related zinc finger protein n=1 Tax=Candidatus Halobonum tyrrellensis G22 TaxID=1324957 RepID=V4HMU8_9EURY|nr:DUF6276 family protein [Candidatus Halobonum tyrrellensis]ESP89254.1 hypothetical protein K933_04531 [Candidatus Halobonum tyrrellensis G22]